MLWVIIILLLIFGVGSFPTWDHSANWGYGPSGIVWVILIILLVLALTGRLQ